jgi:hypothetical protein
MFGFGSGGDRFMVYKKKEDGKDFNEADFKQMEKKPFHHFTYIRDPKKNKASASGIPQWFGEGTDFTFTTGTVFKTKITNQKTKDNPTSKLIEITGTFESIIFYDKHFSQKNDEKMDTTHKDIAITFTITEPKDTSEIRYLNVGLNTNGKIIQGLGEVTETKVTNLVISGTGGMFGGIKADEEFLKNITLDVDEKLNSSIAITSEEKAKDENGNIATIKSIDNLGNTAVKAVDTLAKTTGLVGGSIQKKRKTYRKKSSKKHKKRRISKKRVTNNNGKNKKNT